MTKNNNTALPEKIYAACKDVFEDAPCFVCGYNGPGYYNSEQHPCAKYYSGKKQWPILLRPTAPQNAECTQALQWVLRQIKYASEEPEERKYYLSILETIRAALNQPRQPKIDGLREALKSVDYVEGQYPNRSQSLDIIIKAARAQLAAQEGGAGDALSPGMVKISKMIGDLTEIYKKYGDTCVYIKPGVSWGSVAIHNQAKDESAQLAAQEGGEG